MKDQTNNRIKPVLFVVTSNPVKGESGIPTGFWLSELTHPLAKVEEANFRVEIASIKGGEAPIDPDYDFNNPDPITARYWEDAESQCTGTSGDRGRECAQTFPSPALEEADWQDDVFPSQKLPPARGTHGM